MVDIRKQLEFRINKNNKQELIIFPDIRTKAMFEIHFGNKENVILLTTHNLLNKLEGLRYNKYIFLNRETVRKLIDEKNNERSHK